jgi:Flp pilus assembly protein TadB
MTTLFNMNINLADRIGNAALIGFIHLIFIALLCVAFTFNASADTQQTKPVAIQSAVESDDLNEQEEARQRQLVAEAVMHEKLKMKTDVRDLSNQKRAAGEILGFDVFLGAFLTGLWAMISIFIAAQFSGAKSENGNNGKNNNRKTDVMLFYVSASFMPLMLLWVAMSTGYASWWLTLAISGLIYWLMGFVFKKMKISATG